MWLPAAFCRKFIMRSFCLFMLLACCVASSYSQDKPSAAKPVADAGLCKADCVAVRQDCRARVEGATENDTSPMLSMNQNTNPLATASRETRPQSQQLRPTEAEAFRARRAERLQACEVHYRSCTRACH